MRKKINFSPFFPKLKFLGKNSRLGHLKFKIIFAKKILKKLKLKLISSLTFIPEKFIKNFKITTPFIFFLHLIQHVKTKIFNYNKRLKVTLKLFDIISLLKTISPTNLSCPVFQTPKKYPKRVKSARKSATDVFIICQIFFS